MYMSHQTLVHKVTKKIVRLNPAKSCSSFAWAIGHNTCLMGEDGKIFTDDINNYTHIEDEFGRPISGSYFKDKPDLSLKEYVNLTDSQKKRLKLKSCKEWEARILKEMEESKSVRCPFADGDICPAIRDFFMKNRKAKVLFNYYDSYSKKMLPAWWEMIFTYKGQKWIYNDRLSELCVVEFN